MEKSIGTGSFVVGSLAGAYGAYLIGAGALFAYGVLLILFGVALMMPDDRP